VTIFASGSEVEIALAAREALEKHGHPTRVVSVPCFELWLLLHYADIRAYFERGDITQRGDRFQCHGASCRSMIMRNYE
jgi:transketolase